MSIYDNITPVAENPKGFESKNNAWWYIGTKQDDDKCIKVCREFHVVAIVHDPHNGGWGRIIEFQTPNGHIVHKTIPNSALHETGRVLAKELADAGLAIETGKTAHDLLQKLISQMQGRPATYVAQPGWIANDKGQEGFVLPSGRVVGVEGIILRPEKINRHSMPHGSLSEWKEGVAALAAGNSRLVLAISMAFAAPLLYDTNISSGGNHFCGDSQCGKSTMESVAASTFGLADMDPKGVISTWHSTQNAIEGVLARSNDMLLPLDEMSQASPNEVAAIIYKLGNGASKSRMRSDSSIREGLNWRTLALSTGEEKAENKIKAASAHMTAGIDVRLANIPADAGAGMGVFENIHGFGSPQAFADHLRSITKTQYGTALPEFIAAYVAWRTDDKEAIVRGLERAIKEFVEKHVDRNATSQVKSVAKRFALIAEAGELAALWGIVPWEKGEATKAAVACMQAWIDDRGGLMQGEDDAVLRQVRAYLSTYQMSRFIEPQKDENASRNGELTGIKVPNKTRDAGYASFDYAVFKDAWDRITPNISALRAMRILDRHGFVRKEREASYISRVNILHGDVGCQHIRCYRIKGSILDTEE